MNWVGGARSRVCKADFKSKKGQQRLQKEYFEKRRLGAINITALGKNTTKTDRPKDSKCKISHDILDFQRHIDRAIIPDKSGTRTAFRVVNLNKKAATTKYANPGSLSHEEVELPLSPVDKHSSLQLSQSPTTTSSTSQEQHSDTSYGTENINTRKNPTFHHVSVTSNPRKPEITSLERNHQLNRQRIPSRLQWFGKYSSEHLPHQLSTSDSSSTVDLFGATMKKPQKCSTKNEMPPPSSFGVTSAKAKRKKPNTAGPRTGEGWFSNVDSDSDRQSDGYLTSCSSEPFRYNRRYETLSTLEYPYEIDGNHPTTAATFQLVPSQSSYSVQHRNEDSSNKHDSLSELYFPVEAGSFLLAKNKENQKEISKCFISDDVSNNIGIEPRMNDTIYTNSSFAAEYISPTLQGNRDKRAIRSHVSDAPDKEKNVSFFFSAPEKCTDNEAYLSATMFNCERQADYVQSQREKADAKITHHHPEYMMTSDTFCFENSSRPQNMESRNLFSVSEDSHLSTSSFFCNFSSRYHSEKVDSSVEDGNVFINERLTAEWCNIKREQNFSSQRDNLISTSLEDNALSKMPASFTENRDLQDFEPIETSTPYHTPICIDNQALELDVDKQRAIPLVSDKRYPVTDLLEEMMELETQTHHVELQSEKRFFRESSRPHERDDKTLVEELLSNLVSKVEKSLEQANGERRIVKNTSSCPSTKQRKSASSEFASNDISFSAFSDLENEKNIPKQSYLCQCSKQSNRESSSVCANCQNCFQGNNKQASSESTDIVSLNPDHRERDETTVVCDDDTNKILLQCGNREMNNSIGESNRLTGFSECTTFNSNSGCCHASTVTGENVLKHALPHCNRTYNSPSLILIPTRERNTNGSVLHDECSNPKMTRKNKTASTQTTQKLFKDAASSPIVIFCSEQDTVKDRDVKESMAVHKVYSLRSRSRHCDDLLTKQEE